MLHPLVWREGRTATPSLTPAGSSSHARRAPADAHAALLLARELLHYSPVDDLYDEWLARTTELVIAAGGSPAPSLLLYHPARATQLRRHLRHLLLKKAPWLQGVWPLDETRRVQNPCSKKGAA